MLNILQMWFLAVALNVEPHIAFKGDKLHYYLNEKLRQYMTW